MTPPAPPGRLDWLIRRRPAYLMIYSSVAAALAQEALSSGASLALDAVLAFGETVQPGHRAAVTQAFGARLIDIYSASDTGVIAIECPSGEGYHVTAESMLVELLDEAGAPVPDGTPGRVVVTPIYNTAMPLIRYRLGDFAEALPGPCPCGRTLPRLRVVNGRSRHVFRFADGSMKWPNLHSGDLLAAVPFADFQLVQHTPTDVELRFTRSPGRDGAPDLDALAGIGRRDLHPDVVIRATEVPELSRSTAGKLERYVSLVTGAG